MAYESGVIKRLSTETLLIVVFAIFGANNTGNAVGFFYGLKLETPMKAVFIGGIVMGQVHRRQSSPGKQAGRFGKHFPDEACSRR